MRFSSTARLYVTAALKSTTNSPKAVELCLPVFYVLSIGPNAWLNSRHLMPEWLAFANHLYSPIEWLMAHGPEPIDQAIRWYTGLW